MRFPSPESLIGESVAALPCPRTHYPCHFKVPRTRLIRGEVIRGTSPCPRGGKAPGSGDGFGLTGEHGVRAGAVHASIHPQHCGHGRICTLGTSPLACGYPQTGRAGDRRVMGTNSRAQVSRAGQHQQGTPPSSSLQAALIPPSLWQSPNESDARITHAWRQPHSSQSHCCRSTPATSSLSGGTWGHHPISVTPSQPQCVLGSSKISATTPALHCKTGIKPQPSWEHKAGSSGSPPSPTFLEPCPTRSVAGPPRTARVPGTRHITSSLRHWRLLALAASLIPGTGSIAAL